MNILNSRRKRERRKIEGTVLNEQVDELKGLNRSLAKQNRHLEDLIERAKAEVAKIEKVGPPAAKRKASDAAAFSVQGLSANAITLSAADLERSGNAEENQMFTQRLVRARKV
jgi:hypothetical protein